MVNIPQSAASGAGVACCHPCSAHHGVGQTLNERLAARQQNNKQSRMVVDAREVVYDRDRDRVSAVGDVQILYQGRTLQADRVTYDRKNRRVYAEGNAKLTKPMAPRASRTGST